MDYEFPPKTENSEGGLVAMFDQHFPHISQRMEDLTLEYVSNNSGLITHIVFGGDGIDNPAMSKFPVRPENKTVFQDDVDQYVAHIAKYSAIVPEAVIINLAGNHDVGRLEGVKNINRSLASIRSLDFQLIINESIENQGLDLKVRQAESVVVNGLYITHGDPRIDPYLKSGLTGVRRTAAEHPHPGNIAYGHTHRNITYPRVTGLSAVYNVAMMADIDRLAQEYKSFNGYQNGFLTMFWDAKNTQIENHWVKKGQRLWLDGREY